MVGTVVKVFLLFFLVDLLFLVALGTSVGVRRQSRRRVIDGGDDGKQKGGRGGSGGGWNRLLDLRLLRRCSGQIGAAKGAMWKWWCSGR